MPTMCQLQIKYPLTKTHLLSIVGLAPFIKSIFAKGRCFYIKQNCLI